MMDRIERVRLSTVGIWVLFVLAVLSYGAVGGPVWAGEETHDGRDLGYFHAVGRIDAMEADRIVIDDIQRKFSPDVKYFRQGGSRASKGAFKPGARVGVRVDRKGDIVSLWLLP